MRQVKINEQELLKSGYREGWTISSPYFPNIVVGNSHYAGRSMS